MPAIKILVVENELLIAESVALTLKEAGYTVCGPVSTGEDAVVLSAKEQPDMAIMDIMLDGAMDGVDAASRLRQQREIPLIYLTDSDNRETIQRARQTRPSAYLLKPFNERQLLASIDVALFNLSQNREPSPADLPPQARDHYRVKDVLFIKNKNGNMEKVRLDEISVIEASGSYTNIYVGDDKKYTLVMSLNHVLDQIPLPWFVRVHKSYGINIEKVAEIKGNLLVIGRKEIPLGDKYKEEIMKYFPLLK